MSRSADRFNQVFAAIGMIGIIGAVWIGAAVWISQAAEWARMESDIKARPFLRGSMTCSASSTDGGKTWTLGDCR